MIIVERKVAELIPYAKTRKSMTKRRLPMSRNPYDSFDYLMQCSTKPEQNVLDLFGGSGTAIIAAEQNGRNAYVMEYDPKFVDVIIRRWEEFTGEKAVKL